jgi:cAMP-specific phosphodiesterase 4
MHSTYYLLTSTKAHTLYKAEDILGTLIAALCHDVDHTGRTNSFEVSKGSNLALLYHDTSVLEQHHAAIAFFTLQQENCNIFKALSRDMYLAVRKVIIAAILATDMSKHFSIIARMNERFQDLLSSPLGSQETDKVALIELIVHTSDLAHAAKTFDICLRWSLLVRQEFISQAKEEAVLGLPVTAYMKDLEDTKSYLKNEVSFTTFIVKPLWECVSQGLQPYVDQQMTNLLHNIQCYQEKLAQEEEAKS